LTNASADYTEQRDDATVLQDGNHGKQLATASPFE